MSKSYIIAFNRDRDFYQVPLALAEVGALECLFTDLYIPDRYKNGRLATRLGVAHRCVDGISSTLVRSSAYALYQQMVGLRFAKSGKSRTAVFNRLDKHLSKLAGREAIKRRCALFLYSGYALEAFEMAPDGVEKSLFLYHPLGWLSSEILKNDHDKHPEVAISHHNHLEEIQESESGRFEKECLLADRVICASRFSARSIPAAFGSSDLKNRVSVAPYGCFINHFEANIPTTRSAKPGFLFVGQGVQRKGLHHLLKVWRSFHMEARLTLVLNKTDPGILRLAEGLEHVEILEGVSRQELNRLYASSDVFIMPSLVEGFGLVYLEAFSAGCFVIGTYNTGLPDLDPPSYAACLVQAGDLDALEASIATTLHTIRNGNLDRHAIRKFAGTCSWDRFRSAIRVALSLPEHPPVSP